MLRATVLTLSFFVATSGLCKDFSHDDPLDRLCGETIHAYHRGNASEAISLADTAISYGGNDPRLYYFRGLSFLQQGHQEAATLNFEIGAYLELGRVDVSTLNLNDVEGFLEVNRSLQRVQGSQRLLLESYRAEVRPVARIAREFKRAQIERYREEFRAKIAESQVAAIGIDGIRGRVISINSTPVRVIDVEQNRTGILFIVGVPEATYQRVTTRSLSVADDAAWNLFRHEMQPYARTYWAKQIGSLSEDGLQLEYDPYRDILTDAKRAAEGRTLYAQHGPIVWKGKTIQDHRVWTIKNDKKPKATVVGLNVANVQLREWSWDEGKTGVRDKGDGKVFLVNIDDLSDTDQRWLKENYPNYAVNRVTFERRRAQRAAQQRRRRAVEKELARDQTRLQEKHQTSSKDNFERKSGEPNWVALVEDLVQYALDHPGITGASGLAIWADSEAEKESKKKVDGLGGYIGSKYQQGMGKLLAWGVRQERDKHMPQLDTRKILTQHLEGYYSPAEITDFNHALWDLIDGKLLDKVDPKAAFAEALTKDNPNLRFPLKLVEVGFDFYDRAIKKD